MHNTRCINRALVARQSELIIQDGASIITPDLTGQLYKHIRSDCLSVRWASGPTRASRNSLVIPQCKWLPHMPLACLGSLCPAGWDSGQRNAAQMMDVKQGTGSLLVSPP